MKASIQLKSLTLETKTIQSPMAGCTDLAFRLISREYGMEFAFLEMVSADALVRKNLKTLDLLKTTKEDRPLGAQLVGCNPDTMGEAAAIIEEMGFDLLDLNLGCPVPKIVSPGGGSALLTAPEKTKQIFEKVIRNVKRIPTTVKMRIGFSDPSGDEAIRTAKIAEDTGFCAVTVHGRTRVQGYTGNSDWEAIGRVKAAVSIPVFGNGDVNNGEDAKKLMAISGCDGVMVGRGSLGNPWIFQAIDDSLNERSLPPPPDLEVLRKAALKHFKLEIEIEGERLGLLKSRRIACWYFKAMPGTSEFRNAVNHAQSVGEMQALIENFGLH